MRLSIYILAFFFFLSNLHAQNEISGKIIDANTGNGLAYVNIGVVGQNVGTVSDTEGKFTLSIPTRLDDKQLRISMIGYESKEFDVVKFRAFVRSNYTINLNSANYEIEEITINESRLKLKRLGNRAKENFINVGFETDTLGNEMAIKLKVKRKTTYVKELNLGIANNPYDTLRFRVNFYSIKDGKPFESLNKQNIIVETDMMRGILSVDLRPYNIILEENFFLSLEWIEKPVLRRLVNPTDEQQGNQDEDDFEEEDKLRFFAQYPAKNLYVRKTSQGTWRKVIQGLGISMNVQVLQ